MRLIMPKPHAHSQQQTTRERRETQSVLKIATDQDVAVRNDVVLRKAAVFSRSRADARISDADASGPPLTLFP